MATEINVREYSKHHSEREAANYINHCPGVKVNFLAPVAGYTQTVTCQGQDEGTELSTEETQYCSRTKTVTSPKGT